MILVTELLKLSINKWDPMTLFREETAIQVKKQSREWEKSFPGKIFTRK